MRFDERLARPLPAVAALLLLGPCQHDHGDASPTRESMKDRPELWAKACQPGEPAAANPAGSASGRPAPRPLLQDGEAVFFVGNSFMGWQDRLLPEWVAALGRALSPPIRIEVGSDILFGNTPLAEFLLHPATHAALASHKYQVFVLQGEDFEAVDHKVAFQQAVRDFNRAVLAAGGRVVLFMTWEFTWRRFLDELAASYEEIGNELGIPVIPMGIIYDDCGRMAPADQTYYWLTADPRHPQGDLHENQMGHAVDTYATFQLLTGRNPHGQNFTAYGNQNSDAMMHYLSDMAWARVEPRLHAGCP